MAPEDPSSPGATSTSNPGPGVNESRARFIITLADRESPAAVAADHGVTPTRVFAHVLNGFAGEIAEAARSGLMRDSRVVRVERDAEVTTQGEPQWGAPWGLDRIDQRTPDLDGGYAYNYTGAGVTAYIVDSGIRYTHQEFEGRAFFGFDYADGDGSDCLGHGTHVAGILGGSTYGVAKNVHLVSVRVLDCDGRGYASDIIAGLDWIAAHAALPAVVNMSLGGGGNSTLDAAVQQLTDGGIAVAVAAGNSTKDACSYSPARAPAAMTVAASDPLDQRAPFSNYGSCVDWFAPGVTILSSDASSDVAVATHSGTSMASPHTAGVAALLLEEQPNLSPPEVSAAILDHATKNIVFEAWSENPHLLYALGESGLPDQPPPPDPDPLARPENVTADASTTSFEVTVRWGNPEPRAEYVEVWWKSPVSEWTAGPTRQAMFSTAKVSNLDPGTAYEFRVRFFRGPVDYRQFSEWSEIASATTCSGNPKNGKCSGGGGNDGGSNGKGKGRKG
jgi:subtilisin family serine protease